MDIYPEEFQGERRSDSAQTKSCELLIHETFANLGQIRRSGWRQAYSISSTKEEPVAMAERTDQLRESTTFAGWFGRRLKLSCLHDSIGARGARLWLKRILQVKLPRTICVYLRSQFDILLGRLRNMLQMSLPDLLEHLVHILPAPCFMTTSSAYSS